MNVIHAVTIPPTIKFGTTFPVVIDYEIDTAGSLFLQAELNATVRSSAPSLPIAVQPGHETITVDIALTDDAVPPLRRTIVIVAQVHASVARSNGTDATP
jgi:hypothetical protein